MSTRTNCPSCGGEILFSIGTSQVVVCTYCRSIVARTDIGVQDLGKVATVTGSNSPLSIGLTGRFRSRGFRLTGRTQMRHEAGGTWDEWYAAFDDGNWGWLAEAHGDFYMTFEKPGVDTTRLSFETLDPGERVAALSSTTPFVVMEKGEAEIIGADGEIPWRVEPGSRYRYADVSAADGSFATIDFSDDTPLLFTGHQVTLQDLGISRTAAIPQRDIASTALGCPKCGGALELRAPDQTQRVTCPYCGSLLDVSQGNLQFLQVIKKRGEPAIKLGTTGELDGVSYIVIGYMKRSVTFDKKYYWEEYLLYNRDTGFRWLVNSDGHWNFVAPVNVAEINTVGQTVFYKGKLFKKFQDAVANVEYVLGEFYWKVSVGEKVRGEDFVSPPFAISRETSEIGNTKEVNYSHAVYVPVEKIEKTFAVKLPRPETIGPNQPFNNGGVFKLWGIFFAIILALGLFFMIRAPRRTIFSVNVDPQGQRSQSVFSSAFELRGNQNIVIDAAAPVSNSWVFVEGEIFNKDTGTTQPFSLPVEYYSGSSGGESWSEGSQKNRIYLSALPAGNYSARIDVQWPNDSAAVSVNVTVRQGYARLMHLFLALIGISILPIITIIRQLSFEQKRWEDSNV